MAGTGSTIAPLETLLRDHPGEPTVLLVRSRPAGDQMLERLARSGLSWANVRVATPAALARDLAAPELARRGWKHATRTQTLFLLDRLLRSGVGGSWFSRGGPEGRREPADGLVQAVHRSLMELRRHGLDAAALSPQAFSPPAKGEALKEVLAAYEETLEALALVDTPGLLRLAVQRLEEAPAGPDGDRTRYLIPAGLTFRGLERELVERLTGGRLEPFTLGPEQPKTFRFFHAISPETELRAVLRQVLAQGIPWDQVEVVATDLATYGPILHALAERLGVPVTYSDGLPISLTAPGRGALAYLEWVAGGFPARVLAGALAGGDLVPQGGAASKGAQAGTPAPAASHQARGRLLAQKLLESPIGWGRARYQAWVDQIQRHEAGQPGATSDPVEQELARFLRDLLEWTPDPETHPDAGLPHLVSALRRVVSRFTVERTPLDRGGRVALLRSLEGLEEVAARAARRGVAEAGPAAKEAAAAGPFTSQATSQVEPLAGAAARLARWLGELAVGQGEPRPGALHLASLELGGYAGRSYLFVVGLDEGRFPGKGAQDPLLLDRDRASLPGDLPPSAGRPAERRQSLDELVARAGGTLTCSFASWDPLQGQEVAPSAALLDLFRRARKHPHADYSALREALGAPEGLVPRQEVLPLDRVEGWLDALRQGPPGGERLARPAGGCLEQAFPFLAAGQAASLARESLELTPYDGVVPPEEMLDPRKDRQPVSAGMLETLATCPLQYFFRHVLKIRPPERPELDPDRWLDPLRRGALLHACYHRFWQERVERVRAASPIGAEDRERMEAIVRELVADARAQVPPPSETVFEREWRELLDEALFFVELEAERAGEAEPVLLEQAFGMGGEPAVAVDLDGGSGAPQELLLQGRIDRVDRLPDGTYAVWDYKTGAARRYESQWTHFEGGRQLQHVLYAWAAEELLRRSGRDPSPYVARSGYLMVSRRGRGIRADRPQDPAHREEARVLLRALLDVAAAGLFAPAPDAGKVCAFCDYRQACGGPEAVEQVKRKAGAGEVRLAFWEEVRKHA